jgi:hypothetical protein
MVCLFRQRAGSDVGHFLKPPPPDKGAEVCGGRDFSELLESFGVGFAAWIR